MSKNKQAYDAALAAHNALLQRAGTGDNEVTGMMLRSSALALGEISRPWRQEQRELHAAARPFKDVVLPRETYTELLSALKWYETMPKHLDGRVGNGFSEYMDAYFKDVIGDKLAMADNQWVDHLEMFEGAIWINLYDEGEHEGDGGMLPRVCRVVMVDLAVE